VFDFGLRLCLSIFAFYLNKVDSFSISDLQQFSGIKAHTIRMWEQRYNALTPNRSEGNTRNYDNIQLRRLLNITSLLNLEYKVSELCTMQDDEMFNLVDLNLNKKKNDNHPHEYFISQMINAAFAFDESHFDKLFSGCLLRFSMKETYLFVIYPLLLRLGVMWTTNSIPPAQEHFITNIIRQKILAAIDICNPAKPSNSSWLLFLPENEFHEIGLLFAQYILRSNEKRVIYLGANVPLNSLMNTVAITQPSHLCLFLVNNNMLEHTEQYLNTLSKEFKKSKILLSGNTCLISKIKLAKEIYWLKSVDDLEKQIT